MSSTRENLMMPQTFELMQARIRELEEKLIQVRIRKGEFGQDGDPWDDPVLYELEREEKVLMRSISDAKVSLTDTEVIPVPEQTEFITLGHRIKVKLLDDEYAPREGVAVTLVTENDALLMSGKFGFDQDENLVVSRSTPLGQSIMGARKGETVNYNGGGEVLRARIVNIEVSNLFIES